MFIDEATISLEAGRGGDGVVSFLHERFRPKGGPDGGDGGDGGSIYLRATTTKQTLLDFRHKIHFKAGRGTHGSGKNRCGRKGKDLIIDIPVGTIVRDLTDSRVLFDFAVPETICFARGGKGGKGNARFKSSRNQTPRVATAGTSGESRWIRLELKLLADVGLVGLPNAGKSTLISAVSKATPKIADYPFTTLEPHLGVVQSPDYTPIVIADIPGLVQGAHHGAGLGTRFLKHIERTTILLHLIDVGSNDFDQIIDSEQRIMLELHQYSPLLAQKKRIIALTKIDLLTDLAIIQKVQAHFARKNIACLGVSAIQRKGVGTIIRTLVDSMHQNRRENT